MRRMMMSVVVLFLSGLLGAERADAQQSLKYTANEMMQMFPESIGDLSREAILQPQLSEDIHAKYTGAGWELDVEAWNVPDHFGDDAAAIDNSLEKFAFGAKREGIAAERYDLRTNGGRTGSCMRAFVARENAFFAVCAFVVNGLMIEINPGVTVQNKTRETVTTEMDSVTAALVDHVAAAQ